MDIYENAKSYSKKIKKNIGELDKHFFSYFWDTVVRKTIMVNCNM